MSFRRALRLPAVRYGVPLVGSAVVGSVFLSRLTTGRYEANDRKTRVREDVKLLRGESDKADFDLAKEYERTMAGVDLSNYEMKRIPRTPEMREAERLELQEKRRRLAGAGEAATK